MFVIILVKIADMSCLLWMYQSGETPWPYSHDHECSFAYLKSIFLMAAAIFGQTVFYQIPKTMEIFSQVSTVLNCYQCGPRNVSRFFLNRDKINWSVKFQLFVYILIQWQWNIESCLKSKHLSSVSIWCV